MRAFSPSFLVLALAFAGLAPASAQFSDTTDVTAIQIPVQVVADGKAVRGLAAADFVVYEGRRQRPVVGFDSVDLQTLPADAEVPGAARRWFLMVFDLAFSEPDGIADGREAAIGMLPLLHPSDLVAVATYRRSGIDMVLGFTSDRGQIVAALHSLGLPELIDRAADPLKILVVEHDNDFGDTGGVGGNGPNTSLDTRIKPQPKPPSATHGDRYLNASNPFSGLMDPLYNARKSSEDAGREAQKAALDALSDSFSEIARLMRGISGRKEVVLFSEGFDNAVLQGTLDKDERDRMYVEGSEAGAVWRVDSEERFGSTEALGDLERMLEELRRADCRVHTVDVAGLRPGEPGDGQGGRDSLFQIARDTGGDAYENFNDLSAAVGKMLERSGVTYVLTIQPEDLKADGSYHPLRVELRKGKASRGARVVHRPGYYSPRHFAERGKLDRTLATGARLLSGDEPGSVPTSVLATPFPKDGGTSYVPMLIEADGPALLAGNGPGELLAEIYIYALDENGGVRDYLAQALVLELAKVETGLRQGGLRFLGHLELPPGRFSLRVLAMNGRTGAYGLRTARVEIPEMGAGQPVLLPPLFPERPGQGVLARQASSGGEEVPFPFTQGEVAYLPDPRPELRQGQETPVALVGYHLPGDLKIRTQVTTPDGREVATGGLRVLGRESGAADGAQRLRAAFLTPPLAPGEYLLRVTVSGEGGERTSSAPFVIAADG
ncbi:MAG TPA: VWA domain-containing protein [Thermoanaerobaculia bacterium]|jgi:VWFA-related protein|nr:VWA domain-containing protein [Thermoanaerobaculia bacterium]